MSRSSKKKGKVPKITEAQYAEYISSLKANTPPVSALNENNMLVEETQRCGEKEQSKGQQL